jgi:hypothetical protein
MGPDIARATLLGGDMTEDELFAGITEALTLAGWRWMHIIRSDGVTQGSAGWPDIVACHPLRGIVLVLELKDSKLQPTPDQLAWLLGMSDKTIVAKLVRPADYDLMLDRILAP